MDRRVTCAYFSHVLASGPPSGAIFGYLSLVAFDQLEATCATAREAGCCGDLWVESACRELMPRIHLSVPPTGACSKQGIRRTLAAIHTQRRLGLVLPAQPLHLAGFVQVEALNGVLENSRRRGDRLSTPGTKAKLIVNLFHFRFRAARPGKEAAWVSEGVAINFKRHGRQDSVRMSLSLPASGGVLIKVHRRRRAGEDSPQDPRDAANLISTGVPALQAAPEAPGRADSVPSSGREAAIAADGGHSTAANGTLVSEAEHATRLYADMFSVGTDGRAALRFLDARLRPDGAWTRPGFSSAIGAWGQDVDAGTLARGVLVVICVREMSMPTERDSWCSPTLRALGIEAVRRGR
mmetsp:Transcript_14119/g.40174  ORF Transcript_14119/g.40174 Transcript_14119/m.40174 type:complete len:352 (-) Transcript_14119:137-1192(-)